MLVCGLRERKWSVTFVLLKILTDSMNVQCSSSVQTNSSTLDPHTTGRSPGCRCPAGGEHGPHEGVGGEKLVQRDMQHEDPSKLAMALPIVSSQNDSNELKHHLENSYMEINNSSTRNITLYDDDEANNTEKMKQEAFLQSEVNKFLMPHKLQLLQIIHTYMRSRLRNRLLLQKIRYYHSELQKAKLLEREPYVTSESNISEDTSDLFKRNPNRFKPFEEITTGKIEDVLPSQGSGSVKLPDYIYDGLELMLKRSKQVLAKYFNVTL